MARQIVLDTETTGLEPSQGHRIIEIGCVELVNRRLTGRHYHQYIQPEREVEAGAMEAQRDLWSIQGARRTWFCGSYFGFGFHEDGIQSGLAVAEQLGGIRRPWEVDNESGRLALPIAAKLEAAE